jgi:2-hydroxy-6-oxonona-2,4-dienedioate hydrolase
LIAGTARGRIEYEVFGAGSPVLMVHGTPGGADQGVALARVLALRGNRVIAPSRPGYLGTRLSIAREPEAQADAYADLLDALGIEHAAVIANSGGGVYAAQFALRHPDRVSRLVLLQSITARMVITVDDLLHAALLLPRSAAVAPSVIALALRRGEPSLIRASLALARSVLPTAARRAGVLNDATQIARLPKYPLGEVRVPTLLVHGIADRNVPYLQSVAAADAIPGAHLLTLPGGTHGSVPFDRRVSEAVRDFLG